MVGAGTAVVQPGGGTPLHREERGRTSCLVCAEGGIWPVLKECEQRKKKGSLLT